MAEISYRTQGQVQLPNLILPRNKSLKLSKWAEKRRQYLKENHRVIYYNLMTKGKLDSHLQEVEDGGTASQPDVSSGGLDGAAQGSGYDGLGTGYEQPEDESSGDSSQRGDLQLTEADELPPFTDEARIMTLLMNNDNSLVHRKEFIVEQHGKLKPDEFARYASTIYGGRLKQYNIDGVECGFEHLTDGLLMYEGNYRNRTKESVFSWALLES